MTPARTPHAQAPPLPHRIRILVADDSLTVRRRLCELLSAVPDFEVVGEARDGQEAIALCAALRPDVVTLDLAMPVLNGLIATEHIMANSPTPILIVSAAANCGDHGLADDALAAGALDVVEKPASDDALADWEARLVAHLRLLARVKVITHPRARLGARGRGKAAAPAPAAVRHGVVAIGASTGGPAALVQVLNAIPATHARPILVVLHLGGSLATSTAQWLGEQCTHPVQFARDRQPLPQRGVWLAPAGSHLLLKEGLLRLSDAPERHSCRPSVDVLFDSLAGECGPATVACVLTGMGRDGAAGLLRIRQAGGRTIAQDEASCVVYGMPREAALLGAAEQVLPLARIGAALAATR